MNKIFNLVPKENRQQYVIEQIEKFLDRAKAGDVKGFILFEEGAKEFQWTRCNMNYADAFMGCSRIAYKLNQEWDNFK